MATSIYLRIGTSWPRLIRTSVRQSVSRDAKPLPPLVWVALGCEEGIRLGRAWRVMTKLVVSNPGSTSRGPARLPLLGKASAILVGMSRS